MKFLICIYLLAFSFSLFALSEELQLLKDDKEYQQINKTHCDAKVLHACLAQKCLNDNDETACKKMQLKTSENLKDAKDRMQKFVLEDKELATIRDKCEQAGNKKCPKYFEAMMKAAKNSSIIQMKIFDEKCTANDKDACYYRDIMGFGLKRLP